MATIAAEGRQRYLFALLGVLIVAVAMAAVMPSISEILKWRRYRAERQAIERLIQPWDQPPATAPAMDPQRWRETFVVVYNAMGNVCFSPEHVSLEELHALRADLEARRQDPVSIETLDWFWHRLAKTGPHGQAYIQQMQPLWDEACESLTTDGPSGRPAL